MAHSIFEGIIKKITDGPYSYNKNESVSEFRYKIDVKLNGMIMQMGKILLKKITQVLELMV